MKILVAVDGSKPSLKAVQLLVDHCDWYRSAPQVELVTVHLPVPKLPRMGIAVGKDQIEKYYREEGEANLVAARKKLDAAGVPYQAHVLVGLVAEAIVKHASDKRCDLIYIGTHGRSALGKALIGSTATKVLYISDIPVLLVK
ncbi:MAG TPA: universal stress protein [Burkholderiales bacterium]|nr:universal stress protein [Burkholderiales bacterium]